MYVYVNPRLSLSSPSDWVATVTSAYQTCLSCCAIVASHRFWLYLWCSQITHYPGPPWRAWHSSLFWWLFWAHSSTSLKGARVVRHRTRHCVWLLVKAVCVCWGGGTPGTGLAWACRKDLGLIPVMINGIMTKESRGWTSLCLWGDS